MKVRVTILLFVVLPGMVAFGRSNSLMDTALAYNARRIRLDRYSSAAYVTLGLAGITAAALGTDCAASQRIGYYCGGINVLLGLGGLYRAHIQASEEHSFKKGYTHYLTDKQLLMAFEVVDLVVCAAGIADMKRPQPIGGYDPAYRQMGRNLCFQGASRLLTDNLSFFAQLRDSGRWEDLITAVRFSGTGFGINYPLRSRAERLALQATR